MEIPDGTTKIFDRAKRHIDLGITNEVLKYSTGTNINLEWKQEPIDLDLQNEYRAHILNFY